MMLFQKQYVKINKEVCTICDASANVLMESN